MKKLTYSIAVLALMGIIAGPVAARDDDRGAVKVNAGISGSVQLSDDAEGEEAEVEAGAATSTDAKKSDLLEKSKLRAAAEIDRRIAKLQTLADRAEELRRVPDQAKTSINAALDTQIQKLTELKAKISEEDDSTTVKADIKEVADSHALFTLVAPKAAVIATADRINRAVALMEGFTEKLQARIDEVEASGGSTTALDGSLEDFSAKLAAAKMQTAAAIAAANKVTVDGATKATLQADLKALKEARDDLKKAREALRIARQDAEKIVNGVRGKHTGTDEDSDKAETSTTTETETEVETD